MNKKKRDKEGSKFIKFSITTVSVVLVMSVIFVLLVFVSDIVLDMDMGQLRSAVEFDRTSVSSVIQEAEANRIFRDIDTGSSEGSEDGGEQVIPGLPPEDGGGGGTESITPPGQQAYTNEQIQTFINSGQINKEDLEALIRIFEECRGYEGFYAVASCVRNRVIASGDSYQAVVSAKGQFTGYKGGTLWDVSADWSEYTAELAAAVNILLGGESSIGNFQFFFGRYKDYLWCEPGTEFYVWGGPGSNNPYRNVYVEDLDNVHNGIDPHSSAIIIYNHNGPQEERWKYPHGTHYIP